MRTLLLAALLSTQAMALGKGDVLFLGDIPNIRKCSLTVESYADEMDTKAVAKTIKLSELNTRLTMEPKRNAEGETVYHIEPNRIAAGDITKIICKPDAFIEKKITELLDEKLAHLSH